jgi:hypothetical protein
MSTPKKPKRKKKMAEEIAEVLRMKNKKLTESLHTSQARVRGLETGRLKWEGRGKVAEEQAAMFFNIISDMAEAIPNSTARGRVIRSNARTMMESIGVKPPSSLGSTRNRKPTKRKKKKS